MKEEFEKAEVEIVKFEEEDIITASRDNNMGEEDIL